MSLHEQMHDLFLLDKQLYGLRARLESATSGLKSEQTRVERLERQRQELSDQLKHDQAKSALLESQVKDAQERIDHLRQQMNSVKSNKEYSAVLIEVNTLKQSMEQYETQALEQMDHVEMLRGELQQLEQQVDKQQQRVVAAESEVQGCRAQVGQQLEDLETQRLAAEQLIPQQARDQFNRKTKMYEGQAMATVIEENRRARDYTCGGCYMSIPIERVNALMSDSDQIVSCPSCERILYMDQEFKAAMGISK